MLGITGKGQGGAKVGAKVGANIMRNTLNEKYIKGAFCFFPSYRQLEEHLCGLPSKHIDAHRTTTAPSLVNNQLHTIHIMTTSNPWDTATQTSTTSTSTTAPIDLSPTSVLNRDAEIAEAVRRGLIKLSFAQSCRLAVAKAVAAGLITQDKGVGGGSKV